MTEKFLKMENKYSLFTSLSYQGIPYWHFIRMPVYMEILRIKENLREAHPDIEKGGGKKYRDFLLYIFNAALQNRRFKELDGGILISCTSRKVYQEGRWINPLTYYINDHYESDSVIFELASLKDKIQGNTANTHTYFSATWEVKRVLKYWTAKIWRNNILWSQAEDIKGFVKEFFDIELNIKKIYQEIVYSIESYRTLLPKFEKFLLRNKIKCVVEVCHYNRKHLILNMAAHKHKIEVIELQHGIMGKDHIAYNIEYSDGELPDQILTFGQYWIDSVNYPNKNMRMKPVGYPYFEQIRSRIPPQEQKEQVILFLSQGPFSDKMEELVVDLYHRLKKAGEDYKIIYKLHPNEYTTWKTNYKALAHCSGILVVDQDEKNLYEYFAMAKVQVGVNSTAIFEGLGYGLKTFILDVVKVSFVDDMAEKNIVTKITDAEELIAALKSENIKKQNFEAYKTYFWKENSQSNILQEIEKVMFAGEGSC